MSVTKKRRKGTIKIRIYRRSGRGNTRFTRVLGRASNWQFRKEEERKKRKEREKEKEISSRSGISLSRLVSVQFADERRARIANGGDRCGLRHTGCLSSFLGNAAEVSVRTLKNLREDDNGETRCAFAATVFREYF